MTFYFINKKKILKDQEFHMHSNQNVIPEDYIRLTTQYVNEVFLPIQGFQGMLVRGGVGRKTADILSDIDFTCVFDCSNIEDIIRTHKLITGMHRRNGIMFSGRYLSFATFRDSVWSLKMLHAYSYILPIECSNDLSELIERKIQISQSEQLKRLTGNIIELGEICKVFNIFHGFEMFSEIFKQYSRGEYLTASMEIDRAIKYIKNIIFDLNKIHYPEEKSYYISFFSNLPIQPDNFDEKIKHILLFSRKKEDFCKRLRFVISLAKETVSFAEKQIEIPENIYDFHMNR